MTTTHTPALVARLRAALRLLDNEHITPQGRRILEQILDDEHNQTLELQPLPDHRPEVAFIDRGYYCKVCSGKVRHVRANGVWVHA